MTGEREAWASLLELLSTGPGHGYAAKNGDEDGDFCLFEYLYILCQTFNSLASFQMLVNNCSKRRHLRTFLEGISSVSVLVQLRGYKKVTCTRLLFFLLFYMQAKRIIGDKN